MKSFFALAALVASAFAQTAYINVPRAGSTITAGSNITVTVSQGQPIADFTQVGLAIGLQACPTAGCSTYNAYNDGIGAVLYAGPFDPQADTTVPWLVFHENFTVTVPAVEGPALLSIVQLELVGSAAVPYYGIQNITVNVE